MKIIGPSDVVYTLKGYTMDPTISAGDKQTILIIITIATAVTLDG